MVLDVKPRQPQGRGTVEFTVGPNFRLLGFRQCRPVMLLGFREFSLLLIKSCEPHVSGVYLRVWLRRLQRFLQMFAKNEFAFVILPLLLVNLRQAVSKKSQVRRIRGGACFSHRAQIDLLGSGKITGTTRILSFPSERFEMLRRRRLESWIKRGP